MKLKYLFLERKYLINRQREAFIRKIAWLLPREIVKWAFYRVVANATTGRWRNQVVPDLTAMQAIERWDSPGHA